MACPGDYYDPSAAYPYGDWHQRPSLGYSNPSISLDHSTELAIEDAAKAHADCMGRMARAVEEIARLLAESAGTRERPAPSRQEIEDMIEAEKRRVSDA